MLTLPFDTPTLTLVKADLDRQKPGLGKATHCAAVLYFSAIDRLDTTESNCASHLAKFAGIEFSNLLKIVDAMKIDMRDAGKS